MIRDFRMVRINQMLADVHGSSVNDQLGRTVAEVVPDLWPQLEPTYRKVLETGAPASIKEVMGGTAADPGVPHYWLTSLYPIVVSGGPTGIGIVVVDITDRKKLEESQNALTHTVVAALGATVVEIARCLHRGPPKPRCAAMASAIASEIEFDPSAMINDDIELAARIHDLGKVGVPTEILVHPGRLSEIEMQLVQAHAQIGHDILERVNFPGRIPEMVLQHHERLDGSGYPNHLTSDQIGIGAKVIAVADVAEAMSSHRPYRPALGVDLMSKELEAGRGRLFDPDAVDACLRLIREGRLVVG